jgi:WD40 repeat protein
MSYLHGSVMAVQFVRNTHYMFSVGKDRLVKYWDADKFELLLTLEGHHANVQCLAISNRGDFIVTGSHDRSIRRWDRTEEPFFIEVFTSCFYFDSKIVSLIKRNNRTLNSDKSIFVTNV